MKRLLLLVVAAGMLLGACSPQESAITHFSACPGINSDFDFGSTPDVTGAEIVQIARPGKYIVEQLGEPLARGGHDPASVVHLLRTDDTCGEHDLVAFVEGDGLCALVLGRDFSGSTCLEGEQLEVPAVFNVPTGDPAFGEALAVHVPKTTRHVVAASGGRTIAAFPVNGWVLIVTDDGSETLTIVDQDLTEVVIDPTP
jgi:hypothetical protein